MQYRVPKCRRSLNLFYQELTLVLREKLLAKMEDIGISTKELAKGEVIGCRKKEAIRMRGSYSSRLCQGSVLDQPYLH